MVGEGRLEEVIGNEEHDFASLSAHSLPIWPTCALIQEILRHRRDWLNEFREDIVFLTNCEVAGRSGLSTWKYQFSYDH